MTRNRTLANRVTSSTLYRSIQVLDRRDRQKTMLVVVLQIFMGLLDLVAVAIIGVLGALAVSGVQSQTPGTTVNSVLKLLHMENLSFQYQAAVLGVAATLMMVSKTLVSILFTRRILIFLSHRGAQLSSTLVSKLLSKSLLVIQKRTLQETLYAITNGVNTITMGVLAAGANAISDVSLLVFMSIGLFVVDPSMALTSVLLFGAIGYAMYKLLHKKARELGIRDSELTIESNERLSEVLASYRESVVRNRRGYYSRKFGEIRFELADTTAEISFLPNVSKYVVEITMVVGALFISAIQFILQDASGAVATLSVFLAAGTRIAPAALRLQQSAIQIKGSLGNAQRTLDLIEELKDSETSFNLSDELDLEHRGFDPSLRIENISFTYPMSEKKAISDISLNVKQGEVVAIVGPSGSGKTTLVDLMLGVLLPDSGRIFISDCSPTDVVNKWPGAIAYVPQNVTMANGTVRENIALGYPISVATDELVEKAVQSSQLGAVISELHNGFDSPVGEAGNKLSGGQRQRLGIARALFTQPKLLVLDEATSALDGQTELDLSESIQKLRGSVTVILIAHRLSTVRNADKVIYLEQGRIISQGSFSEVRSSVPDFDHQARLMGL